MAIRSEILIHWTGKKQISKVTDEFRISVYLDLIKSFYADGLRFSLPENDKYLHGAGGGLAPIPKIPMICYTELRLSSVEKHADRYGKLGIGFKRHWLIDHGANPVFYVPNIEGGVVNTNLVNKIIPEAFNGRGDLALFLSFLKPMSDIPGESLTFYDEMEWRMVWWTLYKGNEPVSNPEWMRLDSNTGYHYFKFLPSDVAIIVAPDEKTRKAILDESAMKEHFKSHLPMIVDADKCNQF